MTGNRLIFKLTILLFSFLALAAAPATACTLFVIDDDSTVIFGRTLDWDNPLPGAVFVNPRGLVKTSLPWHGPAPIAGEATMKLWAAAYGSVTFSAYGRDFIASGMNEAGLVIAETSWIAEYEPADKRPSISCAQWMQYQLDNYASVTDVVSHVDDLRLDGEGWHFMVADASGDVAVIESTRSGAEVFRRNRLLKYPILTNAGCMQLITFPAVVDDSSDSFRSDAASGDDAYARYVRAMLLLRERRDDPAPVSVDDAWRMMDSVRVNDTRREIVFDATNRTVSWVTDADRTRRTLHLSDLQFEERSPVLMLNVDAAPAVDVALALEPYSLRWNREVVDAAMRAIHGDVADDESLIPQGFTFDQVIEVVATHPQ